MATREKHLAEKFVDVYRDAILSARPDLLSAWPIISGYAVRTGLVGDWAILMFQHTGVASMRNFDALNIPPAFIDAEGITLANKGKLRDRLERQFGLRGQDGVIIVQRQSDGNWELADELALLIQKHEHSMGLVPMRVFLSHKGADKPLVREFKQSLELLGFAPWLDEDAMNAGAELERSILKGFDDSCAAIFFVTPNFQDEQYLATEVDYAIQQKRAKGDKFSIITLVLDDEAKTAKVPQLLQRYVWKEPKTQLEALREIIKALPVQTGSVYWKVS